MTEAYPHRLREKAHQAAGALGFACKEGVYAIFPGPCYETAAEIRAYEHLGADAIGMSTVPEVIAANYLGMAVLASPHHQPGHRHRQGEAFPSGGAAYRQREQPRSSVRW